MKFLQQPSQEQSKSYQLYINDSQKNKEQFEHKSNKIDTTKYNLITFLPKALLLQFSRPANVYFLFCAIIQCIPQISPLTPTTAIIPIVIVLLASLVREGIEDYKRGKLDKQQNNEATCVYLNKEWKDTVSGKLHVGELVEVEQGETFPADLILIDSDLQDGICFIETGTLDGEKTLKQKESPKQTASKFMGENKEKCKNIEISGMIVADKPNPELYRLNGKMHIEFKTNNNNVEIYDIALDAKQLLLKGAKLENTGWIVGIVVYAGHNCKLMKNAKNPVTKYSSLESLMNKCLLFIFILQCILCIIAAILRGVYYNHNNLDKVDNNPYGFGYTEYSYGLESFLNWFSYLLLLNTLIPISLIITLEVVKIIQGLFMGCDEYCYSHIRKKWLKPNSVSLNEECGLVNYIFSDKTGTLTCNKMEFKYCVIGDICHQYMRGNEEENSEKEKNFRQKENIIPFNNYDMYNAVYGNDENLAKENYPGFILKSEKNPNIVLSLENAKDLFDNFWYALALCHTCAIQLNENDEEEYICVSPDSIELVKSARSQGWNFTSSEKSNIKKVKLGKNGEKIEEFEKLCLIEFSSDRKRETIIIKDKNGLIKLYCKGADSIIEQRLSPNSNKDILNKGKYYVNKFSALGYRTLFIAMKILSEEEYQSFEQLLNEASMSMENKDEKLSQVYDTIENNLYLIGTTIVEDKLQDQVPETIRDLRLANIKIWMLTGDKMNTAENIGLSCNLISKDMYTFRICGKDIQKNEKMEIINQEEREQIILDFAKDYKKFIGNYSSKEKPENFCILVDEKALLTIDENEDMQKIFLDVAKDAVAVICCRVSPLQKSQVVKMMKNYYPNAITLAIGDGGNDVSMIMEAHIGVGIYGEEGMRAVQASDYAIGEFRYLRYLLFFHGRTNYVRNAECIHYFFYKNFVFTLEQFIFGFYCNFTGQTIIDDWFITLFNLLFTSLPLGARALLDHDVYPADGKIVDLMLPFMYLDNREDPVFTIKKFCFTLLKGAIHCFINFFWVVYSIKNESFNGDGNIAGLWYMSLNIFTNLLLIVTIDLIIFTKYQTWINVAIKLVITFLAYIIFVVIVESWDKFNSVGTVKIAFNSGRLWSNLLFICGTCALIDFAQLGSKYIFFSTDVTKLQILRSERGQLNSFENLPLSISKKLSIYDQFISTDNKNNESDKNNLVVTSNENNENMTLNFPMDSQEILTNNIDEKPVCTVIKKINNYENVNNNNIGSLYENPNIQRYNQLFNNNYKGGILQNNIYHNPNIQNRNQNINFYNSDNHNAILDPNYYPYNKGKVAEICQNFYANNTRTNLLNEFADIYNIKRSNFNLNDSSVNHVMLQRNYGINSDVDKRPAFNMKDYYSNPPYYYKI